MAVFGHLYNKPNTILEKQKAYQSDSRMIMQRLPRSQLYLRLYSVGWAVGMIGTVYGLVSLIKGKPSTE